MARLLFDNPGPLFLVVLCCTFLLFRWRTGWKSKHLVALCLTCGVVSMGLYVVLIALNISRVGMLWHDEANILSIAAAYSHDPAAATDAARARWERDDQGHRG